MKGRFLFFMIGLLPFLFPGYLFAAKPGDIYADIFFPGDGSISNSGPYGVTTKIGIRKSQTYSHEFFVEGSTNVPHTGIGFTLYLCSEVNNNHTYIWQRFDNGSPNGGIPTVSPSVAAQVRSYPAWSNNLICEAPPPDSACPDSDGDGLCDPCDQWPDDPNVGSEWYLKGYLKYKGEIVGSYGSPSKTKSDYDRFSVKDEYAQPDGFPGLGMFIGVGGGTSGGFYVDQDIFHKAGGETVFLSDPPLMFKTSCAPVDDITQCGPAICQDDKVPAVEKEDYPLNNSEIPTEEPYIELDKPYYKPIPKPNSQDPVSTDPCPEHRALCTNTCGGSRKVSNFACAGTGGNSHVICSCDSAGGYEFAPGFSDIGDLSFSTATSTGDSSTTSKFGSGTGKDYDPNSVGSDTDDLNQDGDPTNDSYAYKEGQVDFAPVQAAYGRLVGKFPFNLANSFVDVFRPFANAQGSTPTFIYKVVGHVVRFDLSPFNDFARFIRSMFALGLTLSTILALLYIYVGIDFRRK